MKNKINVYHCQLCGGDTVTIHVDEGVTPFMIGCRARSPRCQGTAQSGFYHDSFQELTPKYEWFKPTKEATKTMSKSMQDHINSGGLEIRPVIGVIKGG